MYCLQQQYKDSFTKMKILVNKTAVYFVKAEETAAKKGATEALHTNVFIVALNFYTAKQLRND